MHWDLDQQGALETLDSGIEPTHSTVPSCNC